jgi:hypothetical protein
MADAKRYQLRQALLNACLGCWRTARYHLHLYRQLKRLERIARH